MDGQNSRSAAGRFAMSAYRRGLVLSFVALLLPTSTLRADKPDVLKYVPKQAGFVFVVDNPRQVVDTALGLKAVQDAAAFPEVREALDGTTARRGFQFLKYIERETGEAWPELLDKVAGNGAVVAVGYGANAKTEAALLVLQGRDAKAVEKVFNLVVKAIEEERARQGNLEPLKRARRVGAEAIEIDSDFIVARLGAVTFISNKSKGITAALDLAEGKGESVRAKPSLAAARKSLPKDVLAWFWLDFESLKDNKETKDFFENTRKDIFQTLLFGATADCLRRSEYVAGALIEDQNAFRFTIQLPAGRDAFPPEFALHVPADAKAGSLPLLEPPGVLYSQSFYLDLATLWTEREKLINAEVRKQIEKGEKDLSKLIPGTTIGEILSQWGAHHRIVVMNIDTPPYKKEPGQKVPGFGYVTSMKDPKFGKSVEGLIRAGGLIFSLSQGIKLVEEEHDGVKVFGYRFPEDRNLADDEANLRYNFVPSFAVVDDQFIAGSTLEVTKKLIAEVKRTAKRPSSEQVWRAKAYAYAGAEALAAAPEATISDVMLRQAISLAEAKKQVDQIGDYLKTLGSFVIEMDIDSCRCSFDLVWRMK